MKWFAMSVVVMTAACAGAKPVEAPPRLAAPTSPPGEARFVYSKESVEARGRELILALSVRAFDKAEANFNAEMREALPPTKLSAVWSKVEEQAGVFQSVRELKIQDVGADSLVEALADFKNAHLVIKIAVAHDGSIAGLFFLPPEPAWAPPDYVTKDAFVESPISVGNDPSLPGTLTIPKGEGPFPVAILVHGSGPSTADEQLGSLKVFKDVAWGLASRGVAVIRYVKRSRHSPKGIVTEKEEVVDGALAAIELARTLPGLDPKRVVVVGHSQGGNLAPRIVKESNGGAAGFVAMAGPTRAFQDVVLDQANFFARLYPGKDMEAKVEEAKAFKERLDSPSLKDTDSIKVPFAGAIPGSYFLAMRGYHPEQVAATLPGQALILQGERDYQVTKVDYAGWRKALEKNRRVAFKLYPDLNHAFAKGEGPPSNREYDAPGQHVDLRVVDDIAAWIKTLRTK